MTPPVDQDQRDLIRTAHDRTLFVEAGAGTGKTTALVTRVVEMVASAHLKEMASLAAITFTENAAAELRTRIREALEEAERGTFAGRSYDDGQRARCRHALATLDEATISTLHGFAARILSDVPIEAGLPPGFTVSDAISSQLESARAWRQFVDLLLDDVSIQDHLLAGLTLGLSLDKLRELATAFAVNWDLLLTRPFTAQPLPAIDAARIVAGLEDAAAARADAPEGDALTDHLREVVVPAAEELSSLDNRWDLLEALTQLTLKKNPGNAGAWAQHGGKEPVIEALTRAREAREELLRSVGVAVTETLCARVQDFVVSEAERHQVEGKLDFHDLLVLTRNVLRRDAGARRRMHGRFSALLVDEFQDTDPLQVEIVCLIAGDCGDDPPDDWQDIPIPDGRLFFVGDPKQSIYRFRRADVSIFEEVGLLHQAGHTRLKVNFRSVEGVIRPVNDLFAAVMAGVEGQVEYSRLDWHRTGGEQGRITLLGGPDDDAMAPELREREAEHIAAVIRRAKAERWPVVRKKGDRRDPVVSYADMAILLPTRTSLPALEAALQKAYIPYRVESRSLVWGTDAVRDVVTILQALLNPADEVAIVAALRHHGLACSDAHLTEWAAAGGRWDYLTHRPDGIDQEHPVAAGLAQLRRWHDLRWWVPVNHLVERIVRELRMAELTAEFRRPRDHWRRLRFVVDQARAFCDAGGAGLADFVAWAVQQIESQADVLETAVPEPDDDSVRILTVHGSKGLEFPLTILAGLGVPPRSTADVLWGGTRPETRLKKELLESAGYAERKEAEKKLDLAEGIRLLYVATTRAQDYLVVGCYHKPTKGKNAQVSHAQQVWKQLHTSGLITVESGVVPAPPASAMPAIPDADLPDRATFLQDRAVLVDAVRARVAASATSLVDQAEPAGVQPVGGTPSSGSAAPGTGALLGSAVHGVLELVDLSQPDEAEVAALAALLCEELGIPDLVEEVQARVHRALGARLVAAAGASGRCWREVYVVAQDGERYVEGYIDLLVEDVDGLVVVDYKTDRLSGPEQVTAKAAHYRPQLTAYARALGQVPGIDVHRGALLFLSADGAHEADVDLDGNLSDGGPETGVR